LRGNHDGWKLRGVTEPVRKTPRDSAVEARYLVLPQHANDLGIAFGGTIMSWVDMVAAMAAQRHCGRKVVTVSIDRMSFLAPCHIGDHVLLRASVNYVGHTSMEVGVQVLRENPYRGGRVRATTAYLTFVALDEREKPTPIPPLSPETPDEVRRFENAKLRVAARKELLARLRVGSGSAG
jgi:acyl-CoA hydrolase